MKLAERLIDSYLDPKISGAVFDFMGYLTTRRDPTIAGASHDASDLLVRFEEWSKLRGLDTAQADVSHWRE